MHYNRILCDDEDSIVNDIADKLGLNLLTAKVLCHRGISDADSARKFLDPARAQEFYDPFSMKGMTSAVDRIARALDDDERIVVYGDYDVDGMTASTIVIKALRRLGANNVGSYVPSRLTEGYGLNVDALRRLTHDCDLVITVDCGITNGAEIDAVAGSLDVIVTDHHLPSGELHNAIATLDPHQPDCPYHEKNLCGAGVAFKLCQALAARINDVDYRTYVEDIELAALATVADLVPLTGENRKIVRLGLERMTQTSNVGLRELINVAGLSGKKLNAGHCGFSLGPRLNAGGRLESASIGIELLTTDDQVRARQLALALDRENSRRKDIEARMLSEADEDFQRRREELGGGLSSIVIAREGWHRGVIGLTASKLLERYYLPTIVIALDGDYAIGSCRSISTLHMKEALDVFGDRFLHYGGHEAAAGFTLPRAEVERFAVDFDEYVRTKVRDEDFMPVQRLDAEIDPTEMTLTLAEEFERLAPFGIGNPHPKFGARGVKGSRARVIGNNHLSFEIEPTSTETSLPSSTDRPSNDDTESALKIFMSERVAEFVPLSTVKKNTAINPAESFTASKKNRGAVEKNNPSPTAPAASEPLICSFHSFLSRYSVDKILEPENIFDPDKMIDGDDLDDEFNAFGDFDAQPDFLEDDDPDFIPDADDDNINSEFAFDEFSTSSSTVEYKKTVRAVAWNFGNFVPLVESAPVDITFEPTVNEYQGIRSVQCMISTLEPAGTPEQFPDRRALGQIYKFLRAQSKDAPQPFDVCRLADKFSRSTAALDNENLNSIYTMMCAVRIFGEIGLIRFDADRKKFFMPIPKKNFDLNRSRLFKLHSGGVANER